MPGQIPIDTQPRTCGDEGPPVALLAPFKNPVSAAFRHIAKQCVKAVARK